MAWAVDAAHPAGNRIADRSRDPAQILARGESDGVLRSVLTLAEKVLDRLREVRFDVLARAFAQCGRGVRAARTGPQSRGASLRALHDGGGSVQLRGWMATGFVFEDGI